MHRSRSAIVVLAVVAVVGLGWALVAWERAERDRIERERQAAEQAAREAAEYEAALEAHAELRLHSIITACQAYYTNPKSGHEYPEKLTDLVKPPWGGSSFLNDPATDLLDPWGQPFQYERRKDSAGAERPFVWTERTVDGKTKVIGDKPPAKQ